MSKINDYYNSILENDPDFQRFLEKINKFDDDNYDKNCYDRSVQQFEDWEKESISQ